MFLSVEEKEEETIISFHIDLVEQNVEYIFKDSLLCISESVCFLIILDLKEVKELDTFGLGILLNFCNCAHKLNKKVKIVNINKKIFYKFKAFKIDKRYECITFLS